jgi:2-polyprenyl-3-methyl-5-hydroxy-6-metoxy-1,4-benzoquinol methylase
MGRAIDAFGIGLKEYIDGEKQDEMLERDDGILYYVYNGEYLTPYKKWASYEKQAIKHAKGRVLDIGCGAGRHAIYLQEQGLDVLGIDNSPMAIKISKSRGLKKARVLSLEKMSPKLGKFDTIIMLGNNFGLFQNKVKIKKILAVMYKMTSPDAVIIAESMDPHMTISREQLDYQKRNIEQGRMAGYVRMRILLKKSIGPWFDYVYVSKKEMKEMVEETSWRVKKFYSGIWPAFTAVIEKRCKNKD